MSSPRIHVLLYAGAGATPQPLLHAQRQLSLLLSDHYDIILADHNTICNEPWEESTALLVMPGGRDIPYTQHLNGIGTRRIRNYVRQHNGKFLGLCAGAYFSSREIEFEKGNTTGLEVIGERELCFFDGIARGSVYSGFAYNSESGAHAACIQPELDNCTGDTLNVYFNGGCYFDLSSLRDPPFMHVSSLARYTQPSPLFTKQHQFTDNNSDEKIIYPPAIIECSFPSYSSTSIHHVSNQQGKVILSGVHPEYSAYDLNSTIFTSSDTHTLLLSSETKRETLMRQLLGNRLGLKLNSPSTSTSTTTTTTTSTFINQSIKDTQNGHTINISSMHTVLYVCSNSTMLLNTFHTSLLSHPTTISGLQIPMTYPDIVFAHSYFLSKTHFVFEDCHDTFYILRSSTSPKINQSTNNNPTSTLSISLLNNSHPLSLLPQVSSSPVVLERQRKLFWPLIFLPITSLTANTQPHQSNESAHLFNIQFYFDALHFARQTPSSTFTKVSSLDNKENMNHFGDLLIYSDCMTSTQTTLEKNPNYLSLLPTLFNGLGPILVAYRQTAGHGRGRNSWISPPGCLQASFVLRCRHITSTNQLDNSMKETMKNLPEMTTAQAVFLQYLMSVVIVEAVKSRVPSLPVYLKWPNDIYACPRSTSDSTTKSLPIKIGGIIVNSSYMSGSFNFTIGFGINIDNVAPTSALNSLDCDYKSNKLNDTTFKFTLEQTLADVIVTFDRLFHLFLQTGFTGIILQQYYKHWLHSGQIVHLGDTVSDNNEGKPVRIVGIDEFGLLKTVAIDNPQNVFVMQPDGNSFDMMKGLISRKQS